jgi:hypothetical protein
MRGARQQRRPLPPWSLGGAVWGRGGALIRVDNCLQVVNKHKHRNIALVHWFCAGSVWYAVYLAEDPLHQGRALVSRVPSLEQPRGDFEMGSALQVVAHTCI